MIPYINHTIKSRGGHLGVTAYSERRRMEWTMWEPIGHGRVQWHGVSFTAKEAPEIIRTLLHPPGNGNWQVFKLHHSNGVHIQYLAITFERDKTVLAVTGNLSPPKVGLTDYFFRTHSVALNADEVWLLVGYVMHWAGAVLIGPKTKKVSHNVTYLPGVNCDNEP